MFPTDLRISLGKSLLKRLRIALEERHNQIQAFTEADSVLRSELRTDWARMVQDWLADNSRRNPYAPSGKCEYKQCPKVSKDTDKLV